MRASETNLVLKGWKKRLFNQKHSWRWSRTLHEDHFWLLVNHVIDKITMPSSKILVGCHDEDQDTPLCWAVGRETIFYSDARVEILHDPELAAYLERALRVSGWSIDVERPQFDPFKELSR